jgi:hypothetical protein
MPTTMTPTDAKSVSGISAEGERKLQALRALFADAPELGKKALENVIAELTSQVSTPPPQSKALAVWAPVSASAPS